MSVFLPPKLHQNTSTIIRSMGYIIKLYSTRLCGKYTLSSKATQPFCCTENNDNLGHVVH